MERKMNRQSRLCVSLLPWFKVKGVAQAAQKLGFTLLFFFSLSLFPNYWQSHNIKNGLVR